MYNTNANVKDSRYAVRCLSVSDYITSERYVVDTGAVYTCCNYKVVNETLQEKQFENCVFKYFCGIVNGTAIKFYKYQLKQFTVGNIDMGEQIIWITFDKRVTDIILGMDILRDIILITNPYNKRIYFCKDKEDYIENFELVVD